MAHYTITEELRNLKFAPEKKKGDQPAALPDLNFEVSILASMQQF